MSEKIFYQDAGVTVTNSRFMVNGQMHAMSGITSVRTYVKHPNRLWPILLGLLGLFFAGFSGGKMEPLLTGGFLIFVSIMWFKMQNPLCTILISTAAGESPALSDTDGPRVTKILEALNSAIIYRG